MLCQKSNQIWANCVQALLFLDTLASALDISRDTQRPIDLLADLRSSTPSILILDSFEPPWNLDNCRSAAAQILCDIEQVRYPCCDASNHPPCEGIPLVKNKVQPLDLEPSAAAFTQIDAKVRRLDRLGHRPLAVVLMTRLGEERGSSANHLLASYLAKQDCDARIRPRVSFTIHLGYLHSALDKKSSNSAGGERLYLLARIAMLPAGTTVGPPISPICRERFMLF
ncbi:hypothetical protein C8J56DRAFT_7177 [Mycena floridula]|nr:hypothetical protein C8J56DRAFT_7177 [Mycena floridula]